MINKKYQKINDYINNINKQILGTKDDIYYISNDTLVRNSFASKILCQKTKNINIFIKLIKYYLKSFLFLFIYMFKFILYKIFRKKQVIKEKFILIDTYLIVDKVIKENKFRDSYFIGIDKVLNENEYVYFIKSFYGSYINLFKFYKVIKILNKSNNFILSEFDLLNLKDFFKIFIFIIKYPFKIVKVYRKYKSKNIIFDYSLIDSINGSEFNNYIRYIIGKYLIQKYEFKKIISWCEYQAIDKSFYKGINEEKQLLSKDTIIYGAQFLIPYDSWLNFFIPRFEENFNLTPNILLSNGKYYLQFIDINKKLGVSLRYKHIFEKNNCKCEKNNILVLGSFKKEDTLKLIQSVKQANFDYNIVLRLHPTDDLNHYQDVIDKQWICSKDNTLSEDIDNSMIIITGDATGTSLETICKAKSTLIFTNKDTYTSIPLVEYGKGEIWNIADNYQDLFIKVNNLLKYRKDNIDQIQKIATWYKENFFVEPTEKNIKKAFDL